MKNNVKRKIKIMLVAMVLVFAFSVFCNNDSAWAINKCGGVNTILLDCNSTDGEDSVNEVAGMIVDVISVLIGILGVIAIVVVGIQYMTSRDDSTKLVKAKRRMLSAVVGLAMYVAIFAVGRFLLPGFNGVERGGSSGDSGVVGRGDSGAGSDGASGANGDTDGSSGESNGDASGEDEMNAKDGSEPAGPDNALPTTGDEGWLDAQENTSLSLEES